MAFAWFHQDRDDWLDVGARDSAGMARRTTTTACSVVGIVDIVALSAVLKVASLVGEMATAVWSGPLAPPSGRPTAPDTAFG